MSLWQLHKQGSKGNWELISCVPSWNYLVIPEITGTPLLLEQLQTYTGLAQRWCYQIGSRPNPDSTLRLLFIVELVA